MGKKGSHNKYISLKSQFNSINGFCKYIFEDAAPIRVIGLGEDHLESLSPKHKYFIVSISLLSSTYLFNNKQVSYQIYFFQLLSLFEQLDTIRSFFGTRFPKFSSSRVVIKIKKIVDIKKY